MKLYYHAYKYYPYERQLALREAAAVMGTKIVREDSNGIELVEGLSSDDARRLVYFSQIHNGRVAIDTVQARLERAATAGKKRQSTRYSVHGLHEYKGKFNPQVAKAILNIFGVRPGDHVLDPFCGSGTTLVECAQIGAVSAGIDLNPLAVFIANAKLQALATPADDLGDHLDKLIEGLARVPNWSKAIADDERTEFLKKWFDPAILSIIEILRDRIEVLTDTASPIFLSVASNLLRDYSLQDPQDLRVRRRSSPLPSESIQGAFANACRTFLERLNEAQTVLGFELPHGGAQLSDIKKMGDVAPLRRFDAALTSPPYAMALPYIDTQRLSLVWLGLTAPQRILPLESELIGSREMRGKARSELRERICDNASGLPLEQFRLCQKLENSLGPDDGFRRQAVPPLLYRYFANMHTTFRAVKSQLKPNAPFALIVGHNHTVLGGARHEIDTPRHLTALATDAGWGVDELIKLQTYQRYGYHMGNAVSAETLILLRNP
ncbi:MAG: DNA methyltransferase [bacterium]|nr:DNA methyltransferase [bacterium]